MRPKRVILCVDDNEQDLSVLAFMLRTNGYAVIPVSTDREAIEVCTDRIVDLVLVDHVMPQMDGAELVMKLKQIAPHVPMVLLGDPRRMNGIVHAADALLDKRVIHPSELLEHIRIMAARKRGPKNGSVPTKRVAV